jgi:type I restriction enzyme S subunit
MDRGQLLQHFDILVETPDAVEKLRNLVLDFAVRGRLVPQIHSDENAGILLEKIRKAKDALVVSKTIRGFEEPQPFKEEKMLFNLPSSWRWCRLESLCTKITDGTHYTPSYIFDGVPFLSVKDLTGGSIDFGRVKYISQEEHEVLTKRCKPEYLDMLFTKVGTTGIAKVIDVRREFSIFVSIALLKYPQQYIFPHFFELLLNSPVVRKQSEENTQGIGNKNLVLKSIRSFLIPLPPLDEQKRIVTKVEELLALCDELEARQSAAHEHRTRLVRSALDHLITAKDETDFKKHSDFCIQYSELLFDSVPALRQAILSLAVQGHLVPRKINEGDGGDVVTRFSLRELPDQGQIIDLAMPEHWAITSFANLARIRSGVTKGRNLAGRKTKTFPYLRVANVQRGFLDLRVMKEIAIPAEELEKFRLEAGDLLVTEGGDWDKVGRTAIWRDEISDCIHQNHVFRARLVSQELTPGWFMLYLNSPVGRRYFESASKQTTNLASINATELRGCPIPIPPLDEQKRIVAKVDELMGWCDTLEARLTTAQTTATALLDATLHKILTRDAASTEMSIQRKSIDAEEYFAQLIPALLRSAGGTLTLDRLNAAVALLFLPKILTALVASLDDSAEAHFKAFNQPITEGSFRSILRMMTQNRIVAFDPEDPVVSLHLNESEAPPITPIISKDAQYLVAVLNLVPTQTTRETATQLCPPSLKKELLAIT